MTILRKASAALLACALVGLLIAGMRYYATSFERLLADPRLVDLTAAGQMATIRFGDAAETVTAAVPLADLTALPGYEAGLEAGRMSYRFEVTVPPAMAEQGGDLAFSPLFVNHERFEASLNGRPVATGSSRAADGGLLIVPLTPDDLPDGRFVVEVAATLAPEDMGIRHHGAVLLGPKATLSEIYRVDEQVSFSYFILIAGVMGGIVAVFALFYLVSGGERGFGAFLVYGAFVLVEVLARGYLFDAYLPETARIGVFIVAQFVWIGALLVFFLQHVGADRAARYAGVLWAVLLPLPLHVARLFATGATQLPFETLKTVGDGLLLGVLVTGVALTARARSWILAAVAAVYAGWLVWEILALVHGGFNPRAVLDVALFLAVALLMAREFGARRLLVTKQRDALQKARMAEGVASALQMVAHDVRKPFSMIKIMLDALEEAPDAAARDAVVQRMAKSAREALVAGSGLLQDLLAAGSEARPQTEPAEPEPLFEVALRQARAAAPSEGVEVVRDLRHTRPLEVDRLKLERVVANILTNALEAMEGRGRLVFATRDAQLGDRPAVGLLLTNDGPAIPAEVCERLFKPFETFGKKGGTGLGLAIAQKIVAAHGGTIACRSDAAGTTFEIVLPAADVAASDAPLDVGAEPVRLRIALVDDDVFFREAWEHRHDGLVQTFESPEHFWAACERRPSLLGELTHVVTDYYFDNAPTNGVAFARQLRERGYAGPILVSSNSLGAEVDALGALGAVAIPKDVATADEMRAARGVDRLDDVMPRP